MTCTQMYIINPNSQTVNNQKDPSTGERINNKLWPIHTMGYHSVTTRHEPPNPQLQRRISKTYAQTESKYKNYVLYDSIYKKFYKRQKHIIAYQRPGMVRGNWLQWSTRGSFWWWECSVSYWGGSYTIVNLCQISSLKTDWFYCMWYSFPIVLQQISVHSLA